MKTLTCSKTVYDICITIMDLITHRCLFVMFWSKMTPKFCASNCIYPCEFFLSLKLKRLISICHYEGSKSQIAVTGSFLTKKRLKSALMIGKKAVINVLYLRKIMLKGSNKYWINKLRKMKGTLHFEQLLVSCSKIVSFVIFHAKILFHRSRIHYIYHLMICWL